MYKTLGFKWLFEVFCLASAFVSADKDEARNPQRFIHVNVGGNLSDSQCKKFKNKANIRKHEKNRITIDL